MKHSHSSTLFAAIAASVLLSLNTVRAADPAPDKSKDADARVSALETKIGLLEKRIKDLEAQLTERVTPLDRRGIGGGMGMNDMFEQLQKEMMNNGFDRFTMPNTPGFPGPRGGFNRVPSRKPRLGVELDLVSDELKTQFKNEVKEGAFVMSIVPNSPAEKAGLQVGDAITSFHGSPVANPQELIEAVKNAPKGPCEIVVSRHGEALALKVELGAEVPGDGLGLNDDGWLRNAPDAPGGTQSRTELKVSALELSDTLAKDMKLSDDQKKKASEILAKHQKALSEEFENKGGMKKKSRGGVLQFNMTGNLNELSQKHADEAAKELAAIFSDAQMKQWNDYRETHNSVSFSQSMKTESFNAPGTRKKLLEKKEDLDDAKF